jgi:hypothetical protein
VVELERPRAEVGEQIGGLFLDFGWRADIGRGSTAETASKITRSMGLDRICFFSKKNLESNTNRSFEKRKAQ